MTDREYTEPTNEQLARFLIVYSRNIPGADQLVLSAPVLESLMSQNQQFREGALRTHRKFQEKIYELDRKMTAGDLPCAYIRANGKSCPNRNQPGSYYCGLHIDEEM